MHYALTPVINGVEMWRVKEKKIKFLGEGKLMMVKYVIENGGERT